MEIRGTRKPDKILTSNFCLSVLHFRFCSDKSFQQLGHKKKKKKKNRNPNVKVVKRQNCILVIQRGLIPSGKKGKKRRREN